MDQPLVSVIIVSYNHSRFIHDCLNSIKSQTFSNIELILADDASNDNSVQIFKRWISENQQVAKENYHSKNTGLATILNECIELSTGEYIKILSADDFLHPRYLEECINAVRKDNSVIVFTQSFAVDDNSKVIKENFFSIPDHPTVNLKMNLAKGNFIPGSTQFFKSKLIKKVGKYRTNVLLEDYDFILRAIKHDTRITFIDKNLVYYRQHESNLSKLKLVQLEVETEKLKYLYFTEEKYSDTINDSTLQKVRKYNSDFSRKIILSYLQYSNKSITVIFTILKNIF